jgi:hypothetical protein
MSHLFKQGQDRLTVRYEAHVAEIFLGQMSVGRTESPAILKTWPLLPNQHFESTLRSTICRYTQLLARGSHADQDHAWAAVRHHSHRSADNRRRCSAVTGGCGTRSVRTCLEGEPDRRADSSASRLLATTWPARELHFTETVTPFWLLASPRATASGRFPLGRPVGVCALICITPDTRPGASP